jgi:hypothetical protein
MNTASTNELLSRSEEYGQHWLRQILGLILRNEKNVDNSLNFINPRNFKTLNYDNFKRIERISLNPIDHCQYRSVRDGQNTLRVIAGRTEAINDYIKFHSVFGNQKEIGLPVVNDSDDREGHKFGGEKFDASRISEISSEYRKLMENFSEIVRSFGKFYFDPKIDLNSIFITESGDLLLDSLPMRSVSNPNKGIAQLRSRRNQQLASIACSSMVESYRWFLS